MVPHLATALTGPLLDLEKKILDATPAIERWFRLEWQEHTPPFYCSVDLRNAGYKLAPVDTNLFPGGFNNLATEMLPLTVQAAMAAVYDAAAPVTWADLRPVRVHGPSRDSRGWAAQVEVTSQGLVYAVRGREVVRPPHRLTCQTLEAHRATAHVVESVQAVEPVPRAGERG